MSDDIPTYSPPQAADGALPRLYDLEESYRLALKGGRLGACEFDPLTGRLLLWDAECQRIFGRPGQDITYEEVFSTIHPDDRWQVHEAVGRAVDPKLDGSYSAEYRVVWPDGSIHWVESAGAAYFEGEGDQRQAVRLIGTLADVTERKRTEAALRDSERERAAEKLRQLQQELEHARRIATIGQLTASIVHEVGQPIATLAAGGHAALMWLDREPPKVDEAHKAVEQMVASIDRTRAVMGSVRDLFKRTVPKTELFDLNEAVRDVVAATAGDALRNDVIVQVDLEDGLPRVSGDRLKIQQVMLNLVTNAIQAMGPGERQIDVATRAAGGGIAVSVADTGLGFSPETRERLFEPFFTTKLDGMGIGLPICRAIVEEHGGELTAAPRSAGGSIFSFVLPGRAG